MTDPSFKKRCGDNDVVVLLNPGGSEQGMEDILVFCSTCLNSNSYEPPPLTRDPRSRTPLTPGAITAPHFCHLTCPLAAVMVILPLVLCLAMAWLVGGPAVGNSNSFCPQLTITCGATSSLGHRGQPEPADWLLHVNIARSDFLSCLGGLDICCFPMRSPYGTTQVPYEVDPILLVPVMAQLV